MTSSRADAFTNLLFQPSHGPTKTSHYITCNLVGGGMPSLADCPSLETHLDILVCLRSEFSPQEYFTTTYPNTIVLRRVRADMLFVHYPANDFEAFGDDDDLVRVVEFVALASSSRYNRRCMVHCRAGGTVGRLSW